VPARGAASERAAGTGIAARLLAAAGCRVLGVDPDDRMASVARQGGLTVEVAPFEAWHSAGRSFDALIAAQAWHWVDPVAGAAKAAQVLRPGGRLAVFWNAAQLPAGLGTAFAGVYRSVQPGLPFTPWARPALAPAKLDELLAGIGAAIDAVGGGFTMNYATVAVTAARA
jgi:SAM-dependent methyltransferase